MNENHTENHVDDLRDASVFTTIQPMEATT